MEYWFSDLGTTIKKIQKPPPEILGILSFETAKTMSRLVSLYKSLSDHEVNKLRKEVMRSKGVSYLNSKDEGFLLNLACEERLEELDHSAMTISRLGCKCSDFGLKRFDLIYTDLKLGIFDIGKLNYGTKDIAKIVGKMDRLIWATSALYAGLESLAEMETSERKILMWKKNMEESEITNFDLFDQKIAFHRKHIRHLKEVSLWSQTFNKSVGLMARIICIVYARICSLFGPFIMGLPKFSSIKPRSRLEEKTKVERPWNSGPIPTTTPKLEITRFLSQETRSPNATNGNEFDVGAGFGIGRKPEVLMIDQEARKVKINKILQNAPANTIGGAGLAIRYANVISLAEMYLNNESIISNEEREEMYQMLPSGLKMMVESKLRKIEKKTEGEMVDELLAVGWREAVKALMEWLGPMAHDTLKWHKERNLEKQKIDSKPTVLLLQTLHYSDKEKTEAAIVEVLVGLSFICRYEKCYSGDTDSSRMFFRF